MSIAAIVLTGCGMVAGGGPTATPTATATATLSPTPTPSPTPRPTSTPLPAPEEPPPTGSVRSRLAVECEPGTFGLQVRVLYGATIFDTEEPDARITRIRVYRDGRLLEDSGALWHRIYVREIHFEGLANRLHTVQLHVDVWAAPQPADIVQFTQCPPSASDPPV